MNQTYIVALIVAAITILALLHFVTSSQRGGAPADPQLHDAAGPFSGIGSFIGNGLSATWDNIPNKADTTKQKLQGSSHPLMTYYGHGIPLLNEVEKPGDFDGMPITPHSLNPKCAPECCPSPYSCDHGCLCVDQDGLRDAAWAPAK